MEKLRNFICNYPLSGLTMMIVIIIFLIIIIILLRYLIRREKAYQLEKLSIRLGLVNLEYVFDRDTKMKLLTDEIILLKSEVEILKQQKRSMRIGFAFVLIVIAIANAINRIADNE